MFTIEEIKAAHSKVKSGADFPRYIQDLIRLGVTGYQTFVSDGHTDYVGGNHYQVSSGGRYPILTIAEVSNGEQFRRDLKAHQEGMTEYLIFCSDCAVSGIEKWEVSMAKMTCTYYDKAGNEILTEVIPVP